MSTHLLYLEDFTILEQAATVVQLLRENDRDVVILDQTIFYPQGGGQPYDQGAITSGGGACFVVAEVRFVDGIVKHIGQFTQGTLTEGERVQCVVDAPRRKLMSRLHSAGHIIDLALQKLGIDWLPAKGFHFPDGPYDEYHGSLDGLDKEKLKKDVEAACNAVIQEARPTKILFMPKEEMHTVCQNVPDQLPPGKPARVVMYGDYGIPCGGTHVSNTLDVGKMTIRKMKNEGANVRIAYDVER